MRRRHGLLLLLRLLVLILVVLPPEIVLILFLVVFELVRLPVPLPGVDMQRARAVGWAGGRLAPHHPHHRLLLLALHHLGLRLRHLRAAQNVRQAPVRLWTLTWR